MVGVVASNDLKRGERGSLVEGLLTINGGSSSIRFGLYRVGDPLKRLLVGKIERIGLPDPFLRYEEDGGEVREERSISAQDHLRAMNWLIDWLEEKGALESVDAVGHRVVHGGPRFRDSQPVTKELLAELERISPYDPEHLPAEIQLMEVVRRRYAGWGQVACFDTAFHRAMPRVARLLPIPRRLQCEGVERYGFHGISYAYLLEELGRLGGAEAAQGRVILAHLGNGASLAAVRGGQSVDTSMGFTPTAGLVMSRRSGDLDPGLIW